MYIKLCDRCGRVTKNGPAFLLPVSREIMEIVQP